MKKTLYEQLGVKEYWLFDPHGEWIEEKLRGYRLHREAYELIEDDRSQPLQLRLRVEGQLIRFYRETGEKLLSPDEMAEALRAIEEQRETDRGTSKTSRVAGRPTQSAAKSFRR